MIGPSQKAAETYCNCYTGTSDLGGQIVAALASTAMVFSEADRKYSDKLMKEALQLYAAISKKKGLWSDQFLYPCAPPVCALFAPPPK